MRSSTTGKKRKMKRSDKKRLEANMNFDEWWELRPVRMPSEVLSTLAKVQITRFLHGVDDMALICYLGKEWRYIACRQCGPDAKEFARYAKSDGYRLTFGKCTDEEGTMILQATDSPPLKFRYEAPFGLIRQACKDYLAGADSAHNIREIICDLRSYMAVTDWDVLPTDVYSEIYTSLFPCPRCSTSDNLRQVFHHKGANGRELRYELSFSWKEPNNGLDVPMKEALSKVKISASVSDCMVSKVRQAGYRPLSVFFTVYARDVFAYLHRNDLDKSELVSHTWHQMLAKMRLSLALRSLCMDLVMAFDEKWVIPVIFNPGQYAFDMDRRQFKLPHRSAELDSQLMLGHLRNSFIASVVVSYDDDEETDTSDETTRWVCEMLAGLDNCRIGKLLFSQVRLKPELLAL